MTCVAATAVVDTAGVPVGEGRYACFADVQAAGTVVIWAQGAPDQTLVAAAGIVSQMTAGSTFVPVP